MKTILQSKNLLFILGLFFTVFAFGQGADTQAGATAVPITLPLNAAGTTVGAANNNNQAGYNFDDGPDWYYYYCSPGTATVWITVTFTPNAALPVNPSITIYSSTWGMITAQTQVFGDNSGTFGIPYTPTAGECFYIIIDNDNVAGPNGFPYNIQVRNTVPTVPALTTQPSCSNIGFDNGSTSSWSGSWGHSMQTGIIPAPTPSYTPIFTTLNQGHHNVTTGGTDVLAPIQQVCPLIPGNTNSLRLGDGPNGAYGGARIEQKFSVTAANALFTYYYAAVIQDGGASGSTAHTDQEQPFFKIDALDCAGNPIACGNYLVTGGPGIPGFTQIGTTGTYWKDWTPIMLDLTPYVGSCVTIRFTIGDCSIGAHYAYAYLDATCAPMSIVAPPNICQFQTSTLTAPTGAATYSWVNTAAPATVLGTTNTLSVTPTTTGTFNYQCTMTSVTGCSSTLNTSVTVLPSPQITVTNPPAVCTPATVDITAPSVVTVNSGSGTISYYSDAACTVPIASPAAITTSGTYYIKILNANGCFEVEPVTVVVNPTPTVNVTTANQTICAGQSVNLNATISPAASNTPVTFTNTTDFNIPDGTGVFIGSPITVSGINPQTPGVLPIVSVCLNISHTWDEDLDLVLQCPGGTQIYLASAVGAAGDNFTNTCFVPTGASITTGTAPFSGSFTPMQAFSLLNACAVNGTWTLMAADFATGDAGVILDWSITFNNYTPGPTFAWSPTTAMTGSTTLTPTVTPATTTTYTFTGTSASGGCTASDPVTITVNPLPTATIGSNATVCQNAAGPTITFTGANATAPYTFTYNINGGANQTVSSGAGNTATVTAPTTTAGTFTYNLVSVSANGCSQNQTGSAVITVNPLPTVTAPTNQTVCANANTAAVNFTGTAGATFNWTNNTTSIGLAASGTGNIAAFTATNATTSPVTATITVTPTLAGCPGTPQNFTITVNPIPTVNAVTNQTVCANASTTAVSFAGNIGTTTYNWTNNTTSIGLAGSGTGNIGAFTATNATAAAVTATITVTPTLSGCNGTPTNFTITVNPIPTVTAPTNQTVCANASTTAVTFTGNNASTTYNWTNNTTSIGLAGSGTGNIAAFTATNATASPVTATITVTPTLNGCTGTPQNFTITVNPIPTVNAVTNQTVCANASTTAVTFAGNNASTTYNWTNNTTSIGLAANGTGNIAAFTATNATAAAVTATITVTPTLNGCTGTPTNFTITVNPLPTVNAVTNQTVCANASTTAVTFSGNNASTVYNWTNNTTSIGLAGSGTGNIASFTATNATAAAVTGTITVTPTLNGCTGTPTNFTITVNPIPTVTAPTNQTVCANASTTTVTFTGNNASTTYNWTNNTTSIGLAANGTGNIASFTATNATAAAVTATITVTPTLNGCTGTPQNFTITVNPLPTVNTVTNQTVCANTATTAVTFSGNNASTTYNWTNNTTSIGLAGSGTGNIGAFTATNATAAAVTATITVTPTLNGCTGTPTNFTITVNPIPTVTAPANQTVCAGASTTAITFTGNNASTTYNWTNNTTSIGLAGSGTGNIAAFTGTNATAAPVTGTITVTPTLNGCTGTAQNFTITVNPSPTIAGTFTVCAGSTTQLTGSGTAAAASPWTSSNTAVATISSTGLVTGITPGTTTITYTNSSGCSVTQVVTITSGASITGTLSVCAGSTTQLTGSGTAAAASPWTSSNTAVATVSNTGLVTGVSAGTAVITYTNSSGCNDQETVTVNPLPTVSGNDVCVGGTTQLTGSGTAAAATPWTSSNTAVATISATGVATGVSVGSTTITYTNSNGCSNTMTLNVIANPTIGGTLTACVGATTQLTAVGTPNATNPWTSSNTAVATVSNTGLVTGVASGTSTITFTNASGCQSTAVVTINPLPTIAGTLTVCAGSTTQLTGSATAAATNPWTSSNTAVATVSNTGLVTGVAAGTTTITYTNTNGCSQTANVTVNPLPTAAISGASTICAGSSTSFTITGTPNATVVYNNGTANQNVVLNAAGTATVNTGILNATTTYTLVSAQSPAPASCSNTLTGSVTITVNPIPVMDPVTSVLVCPGDAVVIPSFTSTPAGSTYAWTNSSTAIGLPASGTGDIPQFNATNAGSQPISGTITVVPTLNGCVGSSQTFTIGVANNPNANAGLDVNVCLNAVSGNTIGVPGQAGLTYSWSPATGLSDPSISNPTVSTATAGNTTYTLTVTNAAGCSATDDVLVTINPLPTVAFTSNVTEGCAPLSVTFTNTSPSTSVNCVWTFEGGGTQNGCGPITHVFNSPGIFDVTLQITDNNGCTNSLTQTEMITVYPNVIASFGVNHTQTTILNPVFQFNNTSTNATSYQWDFGDGSGSSSTSPSHTYIDEAGVYHVELIATNAAGCADTAFITVEVVDELIYYVPNTFTPDGDEFNNTFFPVFSSGFDDQSYTLLIFDRWGEIIFESHDVNVGWDGTYHNELCKEGVYTWKIVIKEKNKDKRHDLVGHVTLLK